MTILQYAYSNEMEKLEMTGLARRFAADHLHAGDLPYRLSSWGLDDPNNIRLWRDENRQLVAWAALQSPFWAIDITCQPGVEAQLYPEILAWADQRARAVSGSGFGRPAWFINVLSGQAERIRDLEKAGFQNQADVGEDSWSKVLMRRSVQTSVKEYRSRSGFIARSLAGEGEIESYVELHQVVFESKNMTLEWRKRTLTHPEYRPDLDIVVVSPDGRLVAFCICWFDLESKAGQVEPLGCHPDFTHLGLGRVALSQGLRRLQALGAENIFVETDNYRNTAFQLYESFDFEVIQDVWVYRKDYGEK